MSITVRGNRLAYINNLDEGSITFPTGTVAGDLCVVAVEHGFAPTLPFGWKVIDNSAGTSVNGAAFMRVLTATDIAHGSVSVTFANNYYGTLAAISFVGSEAGVRTFISNRSSTGAASRVLTTSALPITGDYAIYFGSGRFNGTVTSSSGGSLQTSSNLNSSAVLAGGLRGSNGAVSSTFSFSATPTGDYEIIIIIAETPISTLQLRQPLEISEIISEGYPNILQPMILSEAISEGYPSARQNLIISDVLSEGYPTVRQTLLLVETLHPVPPEGTVSTELFPGSQGSLISLPGLQWPIMKRPLWSTAVYKGATGVSVRRANMQYPIWEFELSYEFLRDSVNREFQTLLDFFLARQGGFDTFLFKDKDDYLVTNGVIGTADGVTTQFSFKRTFGTFYEKVGQVDNGNTIVVYHTPTAEAHTIPNVGPYTITINHPQAASATITQDLGVIFTIGGVALVAVGGAPAAGQYSVNLATGVYTFNSADANKGVKITYRYVALAANYTVTMPNLVVFTTAPTAGSISADFQFFFNCRFQDDSADFDKFASTFWEVQKIVLETVPQ